MDIENLSFIIDFKNVIILRLLGSDQFVYVPFNEKVKSIDDLTDSMNDPSASEKFKKMYKDNTLQMIFKHQQLKSD